MVQPGAETDSEGPYSNLQHLGGVGREVQKGGSVEPFTVGLVWRVRDNRLELKKQVWLNVRKTFFHHDSSQAVEQILHSPSSGVFKI